MVAVTEIEPGVVTAAVVVVEVVKSTSNVSICVNDVLRISMTAVFAADVILVPLVIVAPSELWLEAVPKFNDRPIVTPAGTLLNVNRIWVLLSTAAGVPPLLLF